METGAIALRAPKLPSFAVDAEGTVAMPKRQANNRIHRFRRGRPGHRRRIARRRHRDHRGLGHPVSAAAGGSRRPRGGGAWLRSAADAVRGSDIIVSAVTAASSLEAARSVEPHLNGNPYYLDINSVSPGRKQATERCSARRRAMWTSQFSRRSTRPGTRRRCCSPARTPRPSCRSDRRAGYARRHRRLRDRRCGGLKMVRSVMIKGIEALDARMLPRRQPRRHRRRGRGLAQEQLPHARLESGDRIQHRAHGEPRRTPRRRDGPGGRDAARSRHRAADGVGHAPASARWGRSAKEPAVRATLKEGRAAMLDAISAAARDRH